MLLKLTLWIFDLQNEDEDACLDDTNSNRTTWVFESCFVCNFTHFGDKPRQQNNTDLFCFFTFFKCMCSTFLSHSKSWVWDVWSCYDLCQAVRLKVLYESRRGRLFENFLTVYFEFVCSPADLPLSSKQTCGIICIRTGFKLHKYALFTAVRVNWETHQLTTERYVSDRLLTEKLTHSWKTRLRVESGFLLRSRQTRTGMIPNRLEKEMNRNPEYIVL